MHKLNLDNMERLNHLPLTDIKEDILGFSEKCFDIISFIESFPNNQPYCISINGCWGSGKSTMLNFIENNINKKENIVIRFNPWEVLNNDNLISSIFEELTYVIEGKKYSILKKNLLDYGRKICVTGTQLIGKQIMQQQGVDETISDTISNGSASFVDSLFTNNNPVPISKKKKQLDRELKEWGEKEGKRIIVFIDEIDRLFPNEIVEIFKLIKSTISFPGVFFVVAMDKNAIIDALSSIQIKSPENYLVKIFQQRFEINTTYQLQTLFSGIFIPFASSVNQNISDTLLKPIEAIIFGKETSRYYPKFEESKSSINESGKSKADKAYWEVYWPLSNTLAIPRNFINFTYFAVNKWGKLSKELDLNSSSNNRDLITVFLILVLEFIHPQTVEFKTLANRTIEKDLPELFTKVRILLNNIYVEKRTQKTENSFSISYDDKLISDTIKYIKKYPDIENI